MAFRDFSFPEVQHTLGLKIIDAPIKVSRTTRPVRSDFIDFIRYGTTLAAANSTEKAKSEFVIAPILLELSRTSGNGFLLFSGVEWNYDRNRGLNGYCDFILTYGLSQHIIDPPFAVIIEAKNEIINTGFGQCIAAMYAAGEANEKVARYEKIYGIVTTGEMWRLLRLDGKTVTIDKSDYYVDNLPLLMGVLTDITKNTVIAGAA